LLDVLASSGWKNALSMLVVVLVDVELVGMIYVSGYTINQLCDSYSAHHVDWFSS